MLISFMKTLVIKLKPLRSEKTINKHSNTHQALTITFDIDSYILFFLINFNYFTKYLFCPTIYITMIVGYLTTFFIVLGSY
jgi:hypothetical protein